MTSEPIAPYSPIPDDDEFIDIIQNGSMYAEVTAFQRLAATIGVEQAYRRWTRLQHQATTHELQEEVDRLISELAKADKRTEGAEAALAKAQTERDEWIDSFDLMRAETVALGAQLTRETARAEEAEAAVATLHAVIENMHKSDREQREERQQAETALARLCAQLGESSIEWGVQHPLYGTDYIQGADNARAQCGQLNADETGQPWRVVTRLAGQWRNENEPDATRLERYDATPRTALERAADELGVQPVGDVAELGAYEDGRPTSEEFAAFDAARHDGGGDG